MASLLGKLEEKEYITSDRREKVRTFLEKSTKETKTPWYVQILIGMGAWWSAVLFIIAAVISGVVRKQEGMVVFGIAFLIGSILLNRLLQNKSIFVSQLALAGNVAGQIFLYIGVGSNSRSILNVSIACLIVQVLLAILYNDTLVRFSTPILAVSSVAAILGGEFKLFLAGHAITAVLGGIILYYWLLHESKFSIGMRINFLRPIMYGTIFSFLSTFTLSANPSNDIFIKQTVHFWISGIILSGMLIFTIMFIMEKLKTPMMTKIPIGIGTLIICIICINSPGVIAAFLILLIAFHRGNKILLGLSIVYLIFFLIFFYYNMAVSLLFKSFILMGSGIAMLVFRYSVVSKFQPEEAVE